jgi:long-chain fatty acid transport protein
MKHPLAVACTLLMAGQAEAGGLWINEYGTTAQGRAGAGAQAGTGDASTVFHNPASMVEIEKSEMVVTLGYISPDSEFDTDQGGLLNGTGNGGSAAEGTPSGSVFYVHPINDKWTMGVAGVVLTGVTLDYANDWTGRFEVQEIDIIVGGLTPALSYKVTDNFSVGFGGAIMYADLDMKLAVPDPQDPLNGPEGRASINGDDIQIAPHIGMHYQLGEHTRIGAVYLGRFDFDFGGDFKLDPPDYEVGVDTEMTLADTIRVGISHEFNEQGRGHATVGWDNWSKLGNILVSTSSGGEVLPRNWEDTYHFAVGVEYDIDRSWTVEAGFAYDDSPVDKEDRTPDMAMDEQLRYAFGVEHRRDSGTTISATFVYADYGDAEIVAAKDPPVIGYSGEYNTNEILFFSLAVNFPLGSGSR